jgi:hypothetical protein
MMSTTPGSDPRDEHLPDEAFERLRAADPAADREPDLNSIRQSVFAAQTDNNETTEGEDGVGLEAARTSRRPARWFQAVAAVVAVVAVGGGGYVWGHSSSTPATTSADGAVSTQPSLAMANPEIAAESSGTSSSVADRAMIGPSSWHTIFTSSGLADSAGTAPAWGYHATASFTADAVAHLAEALGIDSAPTLADGTWTAGSADRTGPVVSVQNDGLTSFYYNDSTIDPWVEGAEAQAVDDESAYAVLRHLMTAVGVDPAGYELSIERAQASTTAIAVQVLDSSRTGQQWSASVTSEGVYSANGQLASVVSLGDYEIVSAVAAVDRLTDPRFGAAQDFSAYGTMPATASARESDEEGDEITEGSTEAQATPPDAGSADPSVAAPVAPTAGVPFSWPVTTVNIGAATLTTMLLHQSDGSAVLAPSYTLSGDDGSSWSVIAVADSQLDFSATN